MAARRRLITGLNSQDSDTSESQFRPVPTGTPTHRSDNNNDSSESDFELAIPLEARISASKNRFFTQSFIFVILMCVMAGLIWTMNSYNMKQLAKIKEDFDLKQAEKREPSPLWWNHALMYNIYIRSFQDSDGDGVGDMNGKNDNFVLICT